MKKMMSYVCERSVEYVLIPELVKLLKQRYKSVTPLFPWITREGSRISLDVNNYDFKVIGIYARRPKLNKDDKKITIKINEEIIRGARKGSELGIPIIAGGVHAGNFYELGTCKDFIFINLYKLPKESDYEIDFINKNPIGDNLDFIIGDVKGIFSIIDDRSKTINLRDLIDISKDIKIFSRGHGYYHSFFFVGGYKPIYLLLSEGFDFL